MQLGLLVGKYILNVNLFGDNSNHWWWYTTLSTNNNYGNASRGGGRGELMAPTLIFKELYIGKKDAIALSFTTKNWSGGEWGIIA